jgi:FdhE protein
MAPYLTFLAALMRIQAAVAAADPAPAPFPFDEVERARAGAMPPLDRAALAARPGFNAILIRLLAGAEAIDMPHAAAEALRALRATGPSLLQARVEAVLLDALPQEDLAGHLFVAAGVQVFAARAAATLDPKRLVPIATGICPVCGGLPVASLVVGVMGAEGARYAACSLCGTLWNEVRIKCLSCGSTKDISYREVEGGVAPATVKAEVCGACNGWLKILYQNKNPSLEAVADDVASLGLDVLMRQAGLRRAGLNPFLVGY